MTDKKITSILFPAFEDLDQIMSINHNFLIDHLSNTQKLNGFIRIEYCRDDLKKIITNREIVVARAYNKIIGYYLIGKKSGNITLNYQKDKAFSLFDTFKTTYDKIGFGCQVCIHEKYRNNGLFGQMLSTLTQEVKEKYTHLLCSVSEENIASLRSHSNNGWQLIDTIKSTKFLVYEP